MSKAWIVTIGVFDGVHRGHQALLAVARKLARQKEARVRVLTFAPHPEAILRQGPPLLQPLPERLQTLRSAGAEACAVLTFTPALAAIPPEAFLRRFVRRAEGVRGLVVGVNFTFGRGGKRNVRLLEDYCRKEGIALVRVPAVCEGGQRISSTRIRRAVARGAMEEAERLLGRPWAVTGERVAGRGRGKKMGFPTVNLRLPGELVQPPFGVYFVRTTPGGYAVANYGVRPTFGEGEILLEVHYPDGEAPRGDQLRVELLHFLRPEKRFPDVEALRTQIARDIEAFRGWLGNITHREKR